MITPLAAIISLLIGSYAPEGEPSIGICTFDTATATFTPVGESRGITSPSYIAANADGTRAYAVSELNNLDAALYAMAVSPDRKSLSVINSVPTAGASPCYVWLSPDGKAAVTANYTGGSISIFPIAADGSLDTPRVIPFAGGTPGSRRQASSHLHCVFPSPDGRFLFANDLGTDRIYQFRIVSKNGRFDLEPAAVPYVQLPAEEGPRHAVFHPDGRFAYLLGELSGRVCRLSYNPQTCLTPVDFTVADPLHAQGSGDIRITPDGSLLFASNRLQGDGVATFAVDPATGALTPLAYTPTDVHPRNLFVTPDGTCLLVASRDGNSVRAYRITGQADAPLSLLPSYYKCTRPVCITPLP